QVERASFDAGEVQPAEALQDAFEGSGMPELRLRDIANVGQAALRRASVHEERCEGERTEARAATIGIATARWMLARSLARNHPVNPHVEVAARARVIVEEVPAAARPEVLVGKEATSRLVVHRPLVLEAELLLRARHQTVEEALHVGLEVQGELHGEDRS